MRRMPWTTYLWPGLPQLWFLGQWSGLALAVGFGVLLNLLVLASFVWAELLRPFDLRLGWTMVGLLWSGSAVVSAWRGTGRPAARASISAEGLFRQAQSEYLQENWFEAEKILRRLLERAPRDVEARLLLATLLRHNRRWQEASNELNRLELLRDAGLWLPEIAAERRWIAVGQAEPISETPAATSDAGDLESEQSAADSERLSTFAEMGKSDGVDG